jgi:Undecaprenyl-phosphate glucose phosphotransferase
MSDPLRWSSLSPEEIRAHAAIESARDGALNEAAMRHAATLRHGSTSPAVIALLAQTVEAAAVSLALWGALAQAGAAYAFGLALLVGVLGCGVARALGAYRMAALRSFASGLWRAAVGLGFACGAGALAASATAVAAPVVFASAVACGVAALFLARLAMAPVVGWCLDAGLTERRAVLVGGGPGAERVIRGLDAEPGNDIRVVGIFDDRDDERSPPLVAGARKLGGIAELIEFARIAHIDLLIVTLPLTAEARILKLLSQLWVLPVDIRLAASRDDFAFRRRGGQGGLIAVASRPLGHGGRLLKRALDVTAATLALIVLSPVLAAAAVAVRMDSPGPILFRQLRHGYNNRPVEIWKFRSMRVETCDATARKVVTRNDDRVTRLGRFLRKTSIDELPQLFNVLRGDLSLVGPRQHVVDAVSSQAQTFAEIVGGYSARHRTPPGITGWAQINGWRGEIDEPEKLRKRFEHDLYYIENWSIWLDLYILALTPLRLFRTENAY